MQLRSEPEARTALEFRLTPLKVLYIDDDPDIREIAALSLGLDPALSVETAESGLQALQLLDGGLRPDVIVTDVMMPGMDGPSTLAEIRKRDALAHTPVIFITARVLESEQAQYMALGAKGVIIKPFDPMNLPRQMRDILAAP